MQETLRLPQNIYSGFTLYYIAASLTTYEEHTIRRGYVIHPK